MKIEDVKTSYSEETGRQEMIILGTPKRSGGRLSHSKRC